MRGTGTGIALEQPRHVDERAASNSIGPGWTASTCDGSSRSEHAEIAPVRRVAGERHDLGACGREAGLARETVDAFAHVVRRSRSVGRGSSTLRPETVERSQRSCHGSLAPYFYLAARGDSG